MDVPTLLAMRTSNLDELWSDSLIGDPPMGVYNGTAMVVPGKYYANRAIARFVKTFAWQGKTFKAGVLTNRIGGLDILAARIYKGPSLYDQLDCHVLDYALTPLVEQLRDELRQIGPRLYLGKAYRNQNFLLFFALESVDPIALGAHASATLSSSPTT